METYKEAISEYKLEDNEGKIKIVYAYFGLAVYHSQCLEECFSSMLCAIRISKRKVRNNAEMTEIVDAIESSKTTMGQSINEVKQVYNLPDKITKELSFILDKRNFLIHKYFKLEISKFYSEQGQCEMLQYFCNFIDEEQKIEAQLNPYYQIFANRLGITDKKVEQMMMQMIKKEKERVG